jgi:hypothetical protein
MTNDLKPIPMIRIYTFLLALLTTLALTAQTNPAYIRLADQTGFMPTQAQLDTLEVAAQALRAAFPDTNHRRDFAVYDFGFYLHSEQTTGGYPEAFQMAIDSVTQIRPYYLLFGRQSTVDGVNGKFWVDLKLPSDGEFSCATSEMIAMIKSRIIERLDLELRASGQKTYSLLVEKSSMTPLHEFIEHFKECCFGANKQPSCTNCPLVVKTSVVNYLYSKGFQEYQNCQVQVTNGAYVGGLLSTVKVALVLAIIDTNEITKNVNINFSDELNFVCSNSPKAHAKISVYDSINCSSVLDFVALDTTGFDYTEDVIVLHIDGIWRMFYRIGVSSNPPPVTLVEQGGSNKKIVNVVAYWLLKRSAMCAMGMFVDVVTSSLLEFYIGDYPFPDGFLDATSVAYDRTPARQLVWSCLDGATADALWVNAFAIAGKHAYQYCVETEFQSFDVLDFLVKKGLAVGFDFALSQAGFKILGKAKKVVSHHIISPALSATGKALPKVSTKFYRYAIFRNDWAKLILDALPRATQGGSYWTAANRITKEAITKISKKLPLDYDNYPALVTAWRNATSQQKGQASEAIVNQYFKELGATFRNGKYNGGADNGLDFLVEVNGRVYIAEVKQLTGGGIDLTKAIVGGNPAQMSWTWIERVRGKLDDDVSVWLREMIQKNKVERLVLAISDDIQPILHIVKLGD